MADFLVLSKPRGTLQWVRTDLTSGDCTVTSSIDLGGEGGSVAISPDRRHAYVSVREEPAVVTVALDRDGGRLREVGRSATQATVVAVDEVVLKLITGASLHREFDRNPWVAAFVRSLARMLRETEERSSRAPRPAF